MLFSNVFNAPQLHDVRCQCVGIADVPNSLMLTDKTVWGEQAFGRPQKGGLCKGGIYKVKTPLDVYRVWDSSKPWSQFGNWWSFKAPSLTRQAYRINNAICPSWSQLDRVVKCTLKNETEVVVGVGQSVQCSKQDGDIYYPPSPETQIFIPAPVRSAVGNCTLSPAWP